jgi:hypothetical protein
MPQHFIHYVPRRIVLRFPDDPHHPWFAGVQDLDAGFSRPKFHVSRHKTRPTQQVRKGDTIWILGQIFSPLGALPPGLDARIEVRHVERSDDGKFRFIATKHSHWFPLSNILQVLPELESVTGQGRINPVPAHAQRIIGITDAGDQGLIALATCQTYAKEVSTPK